MVKNLSSLLKRLDQGSNLAIVMVLVMALSAAAVILSLVQSDREYRAIRLASEVEVIEQKLRAKIQEIGQIPQQLRRFFMASENVRETQFQTIAEGLRSNTFARSDPIIGFGFFNLGNPDDLSFLSDRFQKISSFESEARDGNIKQMFAEKFVTTGQVVFPGHIIEDLNSVPDEFAYSIIFPLLENETGRASAGPDAIRNAFGGVYRGFTFVTINLNDLLSSLDIERGMRITTFRARIAEQQITVFDEPPQSSFVETIQFPIQGGEIFLNIESVQPSEIMPFLHDHRAFLVIMAGAFSLGTVLIVLIDLSRRRARKMQKISAEASFQKSRFLATMSHEYRTPLNGIIGMTELMRQEPLSARQTANLFTMSRSAESLLGMINDLLDLAKIEESQLTFEPEETDLKLLVTHCCTVANVAAQTKGIELILDYPLSVPRTIMADGKRLQQIITNLLSNAVKFTAEGCVMLRLRYQQPMPGEYGTLLIECIDTGIGIDKEKSSVVFEAFAQADVSTTREFGGTGLGLAIVREITDLIGGEIHLESELGEGSKFTLVAPVTQVGPTPPNRDIALMLNINILFVTGTDNEAASEVAALSNLGAAIRMVPTITDAIILIEKLNDAEWFDVILVDEPTCQDDHNALHQLAIPKLLLRSSINAGNTRDPDPGSPFDIMIIRPVLPEVVAAKIASAYRAHLSKTKLTEPVKSQTPRVLDPVKQIPEPEQTVLASQRSTEPERRSHILIVDDDATNRMYLEGVLENLDCSFNSAQNGEEAILRVKENGPFDIIFMDCQMPVMDGFAATKQIKAMIGAGEIPKTPVVAITANALPSDRKDCLAAGMDDFATKPVRAREITDLLTKWHVDREFAPEPAPPREPAPPPEPALSPEPKPAKPVPLVAKPAPPTQTEPPVASAEPRSVDPIDWAAYDETKSMMNDRFDKLVSLFVEDGKKYSDALVQSAQKDVRNDCIRLSHTLKSTSRMVGAHQLSKTAAIAEAAARNEKTQQDDLTKIALHVKQNFNVAVSRLMQGP